MPTPASRAIQLVRIAVCTFIFIHGTYRLATGGPPIFAEYLGGVGVPLPLGVAWLITIMEVVGTVTLAMGRLVVPLALWFTAILTMGIIMVHSPEGWFVVGAGRNGMEYSTLLISLLLIVAWEDWARKRTQ